MITLYSGTGCSKCMMLKRWLEIKEVDYNEINVHEDEESLKKLQEAKRTSLPVVEINGEFVDFKEYNDILELI